jgi:hypothetical protein
VKISHFDCRHWSWAQEQCRHLTELFSRIATQAAKLLKSERPGGPCEGGAYYVRECIWHRRLRKRNSPESV